MSTPSAHEQPSCCKLLVYGLSQARGFSTLQMVKTFNMARISFSLVLWQNSLIANAIANSWFDLREVHAPILFVYQPHLSIARQNKSGREFLFTLTMFKLKVTDDKSMYSLTYKSKWLVTHGFITISPIKEETCLQLWYCDNKTGCSFTNPVSQHLSVWRLSSQPFIFTPQPAPSLYRSGPGFLKLGLLYCWIRTIELKGETSSTAHYRFLLNLLLPIPLCTWGIRVRFSFCTMGASSLSCLPQLTLFSAPWGTKSYTFKSFNWLIAKAAFSLNFAASRQTWWKDSWGWKCVDFSQLYQVT